MSPRNESTKELIAEMAKANVLDVLNPPRRSWSSVLSVTCVVLALLLRAPWGTSLRGTSLRRLLSQKQIDPDLLVVPLFILTILLAISAATNSKKRGRLLGTIAGGIAVYSLYTIFS